MMDSILQISVAVIAVAFVVLMYFLVQTLKTLTGALEETKKTIGQLREEVSQISVDVKEAVHHTNAMTMDVRSKLRSLDMIFTSVNDIGHAIHAFTGAARESAASLTAALKKERQKPLREPMMLSTLYDGIISSIRIWNKVKKI
ncbi:DUF948 domain-containing protein [Paenibacillus alkaliterrae]|uniref:DUF948 domain-containing protein n=1 Tax=Paenibacillus alkaliterrae TaxID=320909 RepID=UPI001F45545B|nr:DUF948 domain-containing protein [Paenibacillus alkaliterrae]MCF2940873.1 DUF948 domain-containing protein [Paenibacillus alkaliterrae]